MKLTMILNSNRKKKVNEGNRRRMKEKLNESSS